MTRTFPAILPITWFLVFSVSGAVAAPVQKKELDEINESYKRWFGNDLEWRFNELPQNGMVEKQRLPWAGYIYPDGAGGCEYVLRKYDYAFYPGRSPAVNFERQDIAIHRTETYSTQRGGFFGRQVYTVRTYGTPHWAGHCNGWAAAAIRHAEPRSSVTRRGVVFRPSDIKGLLAELYVYSGIETLGGGYEGAVNPATFHAILCNWIGRGQHPIAMDKTLGKEIWNYPIYSYKSSSGRQRNSQVEVKTNIGFVSSTNGEYDQAPKRYQFLYFHYWLDLNEDGKMLGGGYYSDSNQIDLLWAPLQPSQGGSESNKEGNPYLDVKEVLALWRDSVPEEFRDKWYNINPWPEDAIIDPGEVELASEKEGAGDSVTSNDPLTEDATTTADSADDATTSAEGGTTAEPEPAN